MPPLTGNPRPSPADEIGSAYGQQLLIGLEPVAVLLAEHATDGGCLHRAEDEARKGYRQKRVQLVSAHEGQPERRQTLGNLTQECDAVRLEAEYSRREHATDHHEECHWPMLQPELAGDKGRQGYDSHQERRLMRLAQVRDEIPRALPEISVRAFEPE